MYRKTAKSSHYLPRTGNYSTVPKRNGRVDVLPPEAEEQVFGNLKERREILIQKVKSAQLKLTELNAEKSGRLKSGFDEWARRVHQFHNYGGLYPAKPAAILDWEARYSKAKAVAARYQADLRDLERIGNLREIRKQSFAELFVVVAVTMLDSRTFERLKLETKSRLAAAGRETP